MTYPHASTQSATLPYIKVQISSARRSVGIIHTVIDCNIYVCIDCNAMKIRYLAPRKFADFVHLQHSNQELKQQG